MEKLNEAIELCMRNNTYKHLQYNDNISINFIVSNLPAMNYRNLYKIHINGKDASKPQNLYKRYNGKVNIGVTVHAPYESIKNKLL